MNTEQKAQRVETALINQSPFDFTAKTLEAGVTQYTTPEQLNTIIETAAAAMGYIVDFINMYRAADSEFITIKISLAAPDSGDRLYGELLLSISKGSARALVGAQEIKRAR